MPYSTWNLIQWKAAIKLEARGMAHSSGRSVRKHAAIQLHLPANSTHERVLEEITRLLHVEFNEREPKEG